MVKALKGTLALVVFIVCVSMVIMGQKQIGIPGLCIMLAGLSGLLVLLWLYNRKYR